MSDKRVVIVSEDVLPEVILKVLEAKKLLARGKCRTSTEACKAVDVSRSAYYKYKDCVNVYNDRLSGRVVTYYFTLYDRAGVLSEILARFYEVGANVLTINQNIPIESVATATVTVRFDGAEVDPEAVCRQLGGVDGVSQVKIIVGGTGADGSR